MLDRSTRSLRIPVLAAIGILAAALLSGCGGVVVPQGDYGSIWLYRAEADSLDLAAFLSLPPDVQQRRRDEARAWVRRAADADRSCECVHAMGTAAGLAPDDHRLWFDLAATARALGDPDRALAGLDAAEAAIGRLPAAQRPAQMLNLSLQRAWIYKDAGEWRHAMACADSAFRLSPDNRETRMLKGLTRAGAGDFRGALLEARDIRRDQPLWFEWRWINALAELVQGRPGDAYHRLNEPPDMDVTIARGIQRDTLRKADISPDRRFASSYYQDAGLICEQMGRWDRAETYYNRAAEALAVPDDGCLVRHDVPLRTPGGRAYALPAWAAFDRKFVAGSSFAWAVHAVDRFDAAVDPAARRHWSDAASEALGLCIRRDLHRDRAYAMRGHVYASLGIWDLAKQDLRRAQTFFREQGIDDARTLSWLAHLHILNQRSRLALPMLRKALAADPSLSLAWNDMGFALLMADKPDEGLAALDRALALDPELASAWYNRGLLFYRQHEWQAAMDDLAEAARLAPENVEIGALYQQARMMAKKAEGQGEQGEQGAQGD